MAIPRQPLNDDLVTALTGFTGISLNDYIAAIIIVTLTRLRGNRVQTALELKMPLRSLRHKIKWIEALGYNVPASEFGGVRKRKGF